MLGRLKSKRKLHKYLAGITIFLLLEITADSPQEAEHGVQSLQFDHKHSDGKISTLIEDSVVEEDVDETESVSSVMAG